MRKQTDEIVRYYVDVAKSGVLVFRAELAEQFAFDERAADVVLNDLRARFSSGQNWTVALHGEVQEPSPPPAPPAPTVDSLIAAVRSAPRPDPVSALVAPRVRATRAPVVVPEPTSGTPTHRSLRKTTPPDGGLGLVTTNEDRPADLAGFLPSRT